MVVVTFIVTSLAPSGAKRWLWASNRVRRTGRNELGSNSGLVDKIRVDQILKCSDKSHILLAYLTLHPVEASLLTCFEQKLERRLTDHDRPRPTAVSPTFFPKLDCLRAKSTMKSGTRSFRCGGVQGGAGEERTNEPKRGFALFGAFRNGGR